MRSPKATGCGGNWESFINDSILASKSGPKLIPDVAGTFHVPYAMIRLTAHGMCLLLSNITALGRQPNGTDAIHGGHGISANGELREEA